MAVIYSQAAITNRLQGVVTTVGSSGTLQLLAGSNVVSTMVLSSPCGVATNGVLLFTGPIGDQGAAQSGVITGAKVTDSGGNTIISGFSVGIPTSNADIVINNGNNTLQIIAGQAISVVSAQITGS